jgi:hypothetical protein
LSIFFACFIRKSDHDEAAAEYLDEDPNVCLNNDEEYLVCLIILKKKN